MDLSVSLPDELAHYVETKISSGRYASSSEVVSEALRLMEISEQLTADRLLSLRAAWQDGIGSGDAGEIDVIALKAEARPSIETLRRAR